MAGENSAPLRPLRVRIAAAARAARNPQLVLEKDYAVSYLLAGIVAVPQLAGSVERRLIHEFDGEPLDVAMSVYRLEEIAAEKLRAFLQSRQHLQDRGWLRNRPRDLYDLWHLREKSALPVDWGEVGRLLPGKVKAYGLSYVGSQDFLDEQVLQGIQRDWQAQLSSFVADLPTSNAALRRCIRFSARSSLNSLRTPL